MKLCENNQLVLIDLLIILGLIILAFKPDNHSKEYEADQVPFYISGCSEQVGVEGNEKETVYYSISLENTGGKSVHIKGIRPMLNKEARGLLLPNQNLNLEVDEKIKMNEEGEFSGEVQLDNSKLSEEEIREILPLIKSYRIQFNDNKYVILEGTKRKW